MTGVLISSAESKSGKTGIILALNEIFSEYRTAYFKPFGTSPVRVGEEVVDEDVVIASQRFEECYHSVTLNMPYAEFIYSSDPVSLKKEIIEKFEEIKAEVIFVEGSSEYKTGKAIGISDDMIAEILDLKVVLVAKYSSDFVVDRILTAKEVFGERLRKVIVNQLAGYKTSYINSVVGKVLSENDLSLAGVLPRDPVLAGMFVREVREAIQGEFVVEPMEDVIIEHFIIGAMSKESAEKFLSEKENLAIITGGDRKDIQTLALSFGNVRCMILTGNIYPDREVVRKAREKGVPIILVPEDTLTTTEKLEEALRNAKIRGEEKIKRITELVKTHVNVKELEEYIFG